MRGVWWAPVAVCLLAGGCVTQEPYLRWQAGPPSGRMEGKVALKLVPNLRPAERGSTELNDIGRERTPAGLSTAIRLDGELNPPLDHAITRLTIEAMRAAGLAPTQPEDPAATAYLTVEIHDFWCDGQRSFKANAALELVLLDPKSGSERLRVPVNASGAAESCKEAFKQALTELVRGLTNAFAEPDVRNSALGRAQGTTPEGAPPTENGTPP